MTPNVNSLTTKAFNLAYSGLTWLLDKIARLLPSGAFQVDAAAIDKIIQDTFGAVLDKYKVLSAPCTKRHLMTTMPSSSYMSHLFCNGSPCCMLLESVRHIVEPAYRE